MSRFIESTLVHMLLVVSVVAMSWGPVVYLLHTVQMHQGLGL